MIRSYPKPAAKSCLKLWLGGLFTLSYALAVLFILYAQRKKASFQQLERLILPRTEFDVSHARSQSTLSSGKKAQTITKEEPPGTGKEQVDKDTDQKYTVSHDHRITRQQSNESYVKIIHYPNENHTRFATFGVTTPTNDDYFYAFCAPLAVRAWRRIGYESIVFIVGDVNDWLTNDLLKHIYSQLLLLKPVLVFLKPQPENEVLVSQACRLFASNYFTWQNPNRTFIVTTDVDLWPLTAGTFEVPKDKKILLLNSECCGSFTHGSHTYKLLPMGNVVADVATWQNLTNVHGFFPTNPAEIVDYFFRVFGPLALERTRKDEYVGWYMDQRMLSMRIDAWMSQHGGSNVEFVPRDVGRDRLDVNYWMPYSLQGKTDIHTLPRAYKPGVWEKLRPVIKLMYSKDEEYQIVEYREMFMKLKQQQLTEKKYRVHSH